MTQSRVQREPTNHPERDAPGQLPASSELAAKGTRTRSGNGQIGNSSLLGSSIDLEFEYPALMVPWPAWIGHIPFAFWLVGALKPRMFVELGVYSGNSYCAFLQAIHAHHLKAQCFGIDHWRGDEHAGHYDDEVYQELCSYHDPLYGDFSTLLRSSFEEALDYFSDGSIDLLHVDGFHTYDAVSKDFSSW